MAFSFVGSTSYLAGTSSPGGALSFSAVLPSGVVAGDFMVMAVAGYCSGSYIIPPGWTVAQNTPGQENPGSHPFAVAWRLAVGTPSGGEPVSYTVKSSSTAWPAIIVWAVRGGAPSSPVLGSAEQTSVSYVTTLPPPSYTPVAGSTSLFIYGYGGTNSAGSGSNALSLPSPGALLSGSSVMVNDSGDGESYGILACTTSTAPGSASTTTGVDEANFVIELAFGASTPSSSDASGTAADSGSVAATLSDADASGAAVDSPGTVNYALSDADASAAAADGGEQARRYDFMRGTTAPSQAWLTRWGRQRFPQQAPAFYPPTSADADFSQGTDAGEAVLASSAGTDAGHGSDGGELVVQQVPAPPDAGSGSDAGEQVQRRDFALGVTAPSPAWLTRWGRQRFPQQLRAYLPPFTGTTPADTDRCRGQDSEIDQFPSDGDAGTGTDTGALLPSDTDFSGQAADLELTAWPQDTDVAGPGAGGFETAYWTGPLSDTADPGHGTDAVTQVDLVDTEACHGTDAGPGAGGTIEQVDVYTFQPLTRWSGGQFLLAYPVEHADGGSVRELVIWRGTRRPDGTALRLAHAAMTGNLRYLDSADSCAAAEDGSCDTLQVTLMVTPAVEARLDLM